MIQLSDTVVAIATPPGMGAIGIIRLSGEQAISIANTLFSGKDLTKVDSHTLHFGTIKNGDNVVDEVVMSVYKNPKSYTGEDVVEISCHGSQYILQQVLELCIKNGARLAQAGEFTQRAFLNGKLDLASAEAVQDLIASENKASHNLAIKQMRGGFTKDIEQLREQLIHFASMIELELDFGEEDVEFANRDELVALVKKALNYIYALTDSFQLGNAIKNGVSTVLAGRPNAGKSTLLNALLNEERAIVSDIAGTTRDTIEEVTTIKGVQFRLIDTAGIREASDAIEKIGVERTMQKVSSSSILVYIFDVTEMQPEDVKRELFKILKSRDERCEMREARGEMRDAKREMRDAKQNNAQEELSTFNFQLSTILVANKMDLYPNLNVDDFAFEGLPKDRIITTSALNKMNVEHLKNELYHLAIGQELSKANTIVSNARHYEALSKASEALEQVVTGIENGISSDFVAMDIRHALNYLGVIIGKVDVDGDILENIFRRFCIGK